MLYALQDKMIFPGAASRGTTDAIVKPRAGEELVPLTTASGEKIVLLFSPALTRDGAPHPNAKNQPTLIYFYGNGMSLNDAIYDIPRLCKHGFNVAGVEYVGYGMSTGKPGETGIYESADAAYAHLISRSDIDKNKLIPFGCSLGGAAAIHLASTKPVLCVATFSAFTTMPDMAQKQVPFLPARWLVKYNFDNESKIAKITCPAFLAHGRSDTLVPFAMNAKLAAAAKVKTTVVPVQDAGHNDIFMVGGTDLLEKFAAFVGEIQTGK